MTAVSAPLDGRALNSQGNSTRNKTSWDYVGPQRAQSQERSKSSFSKPFSADKQQFLEGRYDTPPQTTLKANDNPPPQENSIKFRSEGAAYAAGSQITSKSNSILDSAHLSPYKQGGTRPAHNDLSRSASEPDSLIDLYGRPGSHVENMDHGDQNDGREQFYLDDEDPEHSRWIHRDKLALIESHEMQEAGIKLPPRPGRSSSKSNGTRVHHRDPSREPSRDRYRNGLKDHELDPEATKFALALKKDEDEKRPSDTPVPDLQTSEETSPEPLPSANSSAMYRHQGMRSSSRIPVPKSSPLPLPQGPIERHAPPPRKRGASGNWSGGDEEGLVYGKTRSRSHSVASQVLLDDGDCVNGAPNHSPSSSPTKRQAGKAGPSPSTSNARKATTALRNASDPQKSRSPPTAYRSSPSQRPKSRSGLESRPATAINRPEGDPPWLATMYKPDPRLPPEQQLLPTHAKRMQQERENGPGSGPTLEGEFGPLTVHTHEGLQLPPQSTSSPGVSSEKDQIGKSSPEPGWPLKPSHNKENGNISGTGNDHGGYSTIPKVQISPNPAAGTVLTTKQQQEQQQQQQQEQQQQKGKPEQQKAARACACCVVM